MKREVLKDAIKDFEAAIAGLKKHYAATKRAHKRLNDGNGTYDPIEYQCCQMYIHLGILRSNMNLCKSFEGSDGKGNKFLQLADGSLMNCYHYDRDWKRNGMI